MATKTKEQQLQESKCYGVAFEKTARECKLCEEKVRCQALTSKGADKQETSAEDTSPDTNAADTKKAAAAKPAAPAAKKPEKPETPAAAGKTQKAAAKPAANGTAYDLPPETKDMTAEAFIEWAKEQGLDMSDVETKYGGNPAILKMRAKMYAKSELAKRQGE